MCLQRHPVSSLHFTCREIEGEKNSVTQSVLLRTSWGSDLRRGGVELDGDSLDHSPSLACCQHPHPRISPPIACCVTGTVKEAKVTQLQCEPWPPPGAPDYTLSQLASQPASQPCLVRDSSLGLLVGRGGGVVVPSDVSPAPSTCPVEGRFVALLSHRAMDFPQPRPLFHIYPDSYPLWPSRASACLWCVGWK